MSPWFILACVVVGALFLLGLIGILAWVAVVRGFTRVMRDDDITPRRMTGRRVYPGPRWESTRISK